MTDSSNYNAATVFFRIARVVVGMLLIVGGLIYEEVMYLRNAPFQWFMIVSGAGLIWSGLVFLVPARWRPSRFRWFRRLYRERLSMPWEVVAYIAIMVILATGAMLGHSNTLLLVFSLMAGPFILNGWVVYAMLQRIRITREVPRRAGAGETFSVQVSLHNDRHYLSCRLMRVEDRIANAHEELGGRVLFFRVPARGRRRSSYRVRLLQRGVYKFGPTIVSSRFPFGLGERGRYFETPDEILIHPRIGQLSPAWWRRVVGDDRIANNQRASHGLFDDEFRQIREYRAGDSVRSIHWRTSARMNDLMVREFEENREHDAVILLDLSGSTGGRPAEESNDRVELAASFVATLCEEFARVIGHANVAFFLTGAENVSIAGKASPELWNRILDALATCRSSENANPMWLAEQLDGLQTNQSHPILVTTRDSLSAFEDTDASGPARMFASSHIVQATEQTLADVFRLPGDDAESEPRKSNLAEPIEVPA